MTCPYCHEDAAFGSHGSRVCGFGRVDLPPDMKRCTVCKSLKPRTTEHFARVSGRGPGTLSSWCRTCASRKARENLIARGGGPSLDPLKRVAFQFGCAKKGTDHEAKARVAMIDAVVDELAKKSADLSEESAA